MADDKRSFGIDRETFIDRIRQNLPLTLRGLSDDELFSAVRQIRPEVDEIDFTPEAPADPGFLEAFLQTTKQQLFRTPVIAASTYNVISSQFDDPQSPQHAQRLAARKALYEGAASFTQQLIADDPALREYQQWASNDPFQWVKFMNPTGGQFGRVFGQAVTSMGTIMASGLVGGALAGQTGAIAAASAAAFAMEGSEAYQNVYEEGAKRGYTQDQLDKLASESGALYGVGSAVLETIVPLGILRSLGIQRRLAKQIFGKYTALYTAEALEQGGKGSINVASSAWSKLVGSNASLAKRIQTLGGALGVPALAEGATELSQFVLEQAITQQKLDGTEITIPWLIKQLGKPEAQESLAGGLVGGSFFAGPTGLQKARGVTGQRAAEIINNLPDNAPPAIRDQLIQATLNSDDLTNIDKAEFMSAVAFGDAEKAVEDIRDIVEAQKPEEEPTPEAEPVVKEKRPVTPQKVKEVPEPTPEADRPLEAVSEPSGGVSEPVLEPTVTEPVTTEPVTTEPATLEPEIPEVQEPEIPEFDVPAAKINVLETILSPTESVSERVLTSRDTPEQVVEHSLRNITQFDKEFKALPKEQQNEVLSLLGLGLEKLSPTKPALRNQQGEFSRAKLRSLLRELRRNNFLVQTQQVSKGLEGVEFVRTLVPAGQVVAPEVLQPKVEEDRVDQIVIDAIGSDRPIRQLKTIAPEESTLSAIKKAREFLGVDRFKKLAQQFKEMIREEREAIGDTFLENIDPELLEAESTERFARHVVEQITPKEAAGLAVGAEVNTGNGQGVVVAIDGKKVTVRLTKPLSPELDPIGSTVEFLAEELEIVEPDASRAELRISEGEIPARFFHVTDASNLKRIKKEGLTPETSKKGLVFLTDRQGALDISASGQLDDSVILEVDVDRSDISLARAISMVSDDEGGFLRTLEFQTLKAIAPSQIKEVEHRKLAAEQLDFPEVKADPSRLVEGQGQVSDEALEGFQLFSAVPKTQLAFKQGEITPKAQKLLDRLQQQLPFVTIEVYQRLLDEHGAEVSGRALQSAVHFSRSFAKLDTFPHEFAHVYINMLRHDPLVRRATAEFGDEEALVRHIGEYYADRLVGSVKKKIELWLRRFINKLRKLFGSAQNAGDLIAEEFFQLERQPAPNLPLPAQAKYQLLGDVHDQTIQTNTPDSREGKSFEDLLEEMYDNDPAVMMERNFFAEYGVYLTEETVAKMYQYARDNKHLNFLNDAEFTKAVSDLRTIAQESIPEKKLPSPSPKFARLTKAWWQKANSTSFVDFDRSSGIGRWKNHIIVRGDNFVVRPIKTQKITDPMGKTKELAINPSTNKPYASREMQNFLEEDQSLGAMNKLIYMNTRDSVHVVVPSRNNPEGFYYKAGTDFDLTFNETTVRRLNKAFSDAFFAKKTNVLEYFFAESQGDNSQLVFSAVGTNVKALFQGKDFSDYPAIFDQYLQNEVAKGNMTESDRKNYKDSADFLFESDGNKGIYMQLAANHEKWKSIKGKDYLTRGKIKSVADLFKRLKIDLGKGTVPRGIGNSSIMVVDDTKVTFEVDGNPISHQKPDGTYALDGMTMTSAKYMQKMNKVLGKNGLVYKTYIRDLDVTNPDENGEYSDYIAVKHLEMTPPEGLQVFQEEDGVKKLLATYRNGTWKSADGVVFDRLSTPNEVKDFAGRYANFNEVHVLPERATRVLKVADKDKLTGAFPILGFELMLDTDFIDNNPSAKAVMDAAHKHYQDLARQYIDKLSTMRESPEEFANFLKRDLQEGELPTNIQRLIQIAPESLYLKSNIEEITSMINNDFILNGLYKAKQIQKGRSTFLTLKPNFNEDIKEGHIAISADDRVMLRRALERSGLQTQGIPPREVIRRLNEWLQNNEFWVLVHRTPIQSFTKVVPRRVQKFVLGNHGKVVFQRPDDVFRVHEADFDGDIVFIEDTGDSNLIPALREMQDTQAFKDRDKVVDLGIFQPGPLGTKLSSYRDVLNIMTNNTKLRNVQGFVVNAKTLLSVMSFKELSFTDQNGRTWSVSKPTDRTIMDYWELGELTEAQRTLIEQNGDKIVEIGTGVTEVVNIPNNIMGFIGDVETENSLQADAIFQIASRTRITNKRDLIQGGQVTKLFTPDRGDILVTRENKEFGPTEDMKEEIQRLSDRNFFVDDSDAIMKDYFKESNIDFTPITLKTKQVGTGKRYLETTKENEFSILLQAAVDNEKFGLFNKLPLEAGLFNWLQSKIWKDENGKRPTPIDYAKIGIAVSAYNLSQLRQGNFNGKRLNLAGNLNMSTLMSERYFDPEGNTIPTEEINETVWEQVKDQIDKSRSRAKMLAISQIDNLTSNGRMTPAETLLTRFGREMNRINNEAISGGLVFDDFIKLADDNKYKYTHRLALGKMARDMANKLAEQIKEGNADLIKSGLALGRDMQVEFHDVFQRVELERNKDRVGNARDNQPVYLSLDYSKELADFVTKWNPKWLSMSPIERTWSTIYFLAGGEIQGRPITNVGKLLPSYLMDEAVLRQYSKLYKDNLYIPDDRVDLIDDPAITELNTMTRKIDELKDQYCG